jgi:hypothetical protein
MQMPVNDPLLCQAACRADDRCTAWTQTEPGVQGPLARCWLKNRIPSSEASDKCCTSGIERAQAVTPWPQPDGKILAGINLNGQDYRVFEPAQADAKLCQAACRDEKQCLAWTFDRPSNKAKNGRCGLKNRIPVQSANSCCTSAVERTQ